MNADSGLWLRFLSGPDIDSLGLSNADIVAAVEEAAVGLAILRRAEQRDAGTVLRYR